ncbi:TPA: hypothetical protein ACF0M1_002344 [Enterococcus hirae]|uniref:Uncharacterized protein n=1 Tax=Enterococcus hirae TaxID=1354 RepID=A0A7Z9AWI9_ENTHR|nr:hypothetical protein [Enterococcus hirae]EOH67495.1 hypothetical protein UAE_02724 [Enterococcus hirae ATCC 9790]EOU03359.1 hypothetical protein I584_02732 [Enterococcus hirae ATCC 9790]OJG49233.1 hypothetical protein RV05_GL001363 [Enterococcus hirae]QQY20805.1 hypothetical protein I6I80_00380 [Enterococcus hirae]VTQ74140.1 Uncharacterised protein [Enterococcus hirae]
MGLFFSTYRVEHNTGLFFSNWVTVLRNVDFKEAESYVRDKTSGLLGESKNKYRIVKE